MGSTNDILDISVTLQSGGIGKVGFGTLLIATPDVNFAADAVKEYTSPAALLADTDAGVTTSDQIYKDLVDAFASSLRPKSVKVGKVDSTLFAKQDERVTITAVPAGAQVWTVTVDGVAYPTATIPADPVPTVAIAAAAMALALADIPYVTCAYTPAAVLFDLEADSAGDGFTLAVTAPTGGTYTITHTLDNYGYGDELSLILAEDSDWYGLAITDRDPGNCQEVAAWVEARGFGVFVAQSDEAEIIDDAEDDDLASRLKNADYQRSAVLYYSDDTEGAAAAWLANRLRVDPDVETTIWPYVTLQSIGTDDLTVDEMDAAEDKNANYYTLWGFGVTKPGVTADGTAIERIITMDWLYNRLFEAHRNQLIDYVNRGTKIPMSDQGISTVAAAAHAVFRRGVQAGHFSSYELDLPSEDDFTPEDLEEGRVTYSFAAYELRGVKGVTVTGTVGIYTV